MGDIYVFGAGATCIDVSAMGKGDGLMGPSCRPLCVFLSEIKHVEPASQLFHLFTVLFFLIHLARCVCVMCGHFAIASIQFKAVVIHECTSRFARSLFKYHLGSKYTVHTFNPPAVL